MIILPSQFYPLIIPLMLVGQEMLPDDDNGNDDNDDDNDDNDDNDDTSHIHLR